MACRGVISCGELPIFLWSPRDESCILSAYPPHASINTAGVGGLRQWTHEDASDFPQADLDLPLEPWTANFYQCWFYVGLQWLIVDRSKVAVGDPELGS